MGRYTGLVQVLIRVIGIITLAISLTKMPYWFEGLDFLFEAKSVVIETYTSTALVQTTWFVAYWLASMLLSLLAIMAPKFVMSFLCLGVSKTGMDDASHTEDVHLHDAAYWQEVGIALMGLWFVATCIPNLASLLLKIWTHDDSAYAMHEIDNVVIFDVAHYAVLLLIGLFLLFGKNKIIRAIKRTRY